jgi:hypothetical protein
VSGTSGPATRALAAGAVAVAALAFFAHGAVSVGAGYLDCVSGIWLALGRDVDAGHFYRPLLSELGYGGTRYFPLFFLIIGAFLRLGAGILTAGWLTSALTAIILAAGMYRLVRRLDGAGWVAIWPRRLPMLRAATLFEVPRRRVSRGVQRLGLAFVLPAWR